MTQLTLSKINVIWNDYKVSTIKKTDRKYKQPYTSFFKAKETEASIFSKNKIVPLSHLNATYVDMYNNS
jgi:hypothetical protein